MKEILLAKYGEIALKGLNKRWFEQILNRELRHRLAPYGEFTISSAQSTVTIEPVADDCDMDGAFDALSHVFGFAAIGRAAMTEKTYEAISEAARSYIPRFLAGKKTFKVEAKRSDKRFPLKSPEICREIGGDILDEVNSKGGKLRVDVNNPEVMVRVEVRDTSAFITAGDPEYYGQCPGAGGMPYGTNGRGLLLLSGGIDSPVAGYMLAKRGVIIEAIHFESYPYTSERARCKVLELARQLCAYTGSVRVHVVSVTHLQEVLRDRCDEDYFTLLLRRFMMRIANRIARRAGCAALITGESIGQVASQTMMALNVTDALADYPVFRPCIGMDKEEIVRISRRIGTYETSILPYEDCCTVFTPKHPKTRPEIAKVEAQEEKLDVAALVEESVHTAALYSVHFDSVAEEIVGVTEKWMDTPHTDAADGADNALSDCADSALSDCADSADNVSSDDANSADNASSDVADAASPDEV